MTGRLDRAGAAVATALQILPVTGDPGHMSPGELAAGLALILRARCGPMERLTLASAALMALDRDNLDSLMTAAQRDLDRRTSDGHSSFRERHIEGRARP